MLQNADDASEIDVEKNKPGFLAFCKRVPCLQSSCGFIFGCSALKFCGDVEHMLPVTVVIKIDFVEKPKVEKILSKKNAVKNIPSNFREMYSGTFLE